MLKDFHKISDLFGTILNNKSYKNLWKNWHENNQNNETANKLDLPASSNNRFAYRRTLDILGNGNVAILINHENGSSVYVYDVTTEALSEEVTYTGADYIGGIKAYSTFLLPEIN